MIKEKLKLTLLASLVIFAAAPSAQAANVSGKITFQGTPPAGTILKADADPNCKMQNPNGIQPDDVIVATDGGLKNVFVYVKEGLAGKTFEAPKDAVVMDQKGCHYEPKVFGIQANQPLEIRNSDDTLHNVHALPKNSPQFNLGMPIKGMKLKKTFAKPEVMVKIKCEVHPWMGAYAGVVDNPYYAVTKEDGSFEIKDLPAGEYTLEAWHETFGTQTQKVTVSDQAQTVAFEFKSA